ncbi:MAG: Holliday junction resolvase RuvX [Candidatus Absconditabacteria bacterium]
MFAGREKSILSIDWGSKYIGLAYVKENSKVVMPIGYILNDGSVFFNLGDLLMRYRVKNIVVGYPKKSEIIQELIDGFIKNLSMMISEDIVIDKIDEDYTTVEAGEVISNFRAKEEKTTKDTISAMKILERYLVIKDI